MDAASKKLDVLIKLMQRLLVIKGPAPINYVTIKGTIAAENLEEAGTWTSEQVAHLAHALRKYLLDSPPPPAIKTSFICNETTYINFVQQTQVLGITPSDPNSAAHTMIGNLQGVLKMEKNIDMETSYDVTILNRKNKIEGAGVKKLKNIISNLNGSDGFLGPLALDKVTASQRVNNLDTKNKSYFTLLDMKL
ncbi:hypothetical protein O0I10_000844 [Lichtheimia ornata]|uniref:Uncharacterized protein n=1 Tax=Lichtheimia ornata TaxID=688661 RepID=A0AAD8DHZ9_9FUNG|nr:uncharacterized protein O0I10_000844 [Lichtheimia ornata]KAJ8663599.1 hypothetical protein O0I10_000844 [Lichtheimia ornata]